MAESGSEDGEKAGAVKAIREAWAAIQKARNAAGNEEAVKEAESFLTEARIAMKMGEHRAALECAQKAHFMAEDSLKKEGVEEDWVIKYQELLTLMKEAESRINTAKTNAVPTAISEENYQLAMKLMAEKDYEGSKEAFLKAIFSLESVTKEYNRVKDIVLKAQLAVTDLKGQGFDVTKLDGMVNKALIALDYGRFDEAVSLAEDILKGCISMTTLAKEAKKTLKRAEKALNEAEAEGMVVAPLKEEIDVARRAFDDGDYEQAFNIAKEIVARIGGGLEVYHSLTDSIKDARNKIINLRALGIDTKNFDLAISEVMEMITDRKYDQAKEKMEDVAMALDEISTLASDIARYKDDMENDLKALEDMGRDTAGFRESLEQGRKALDNMEFKHAHQIFESASKHARKYLNSIKRMNEIVKAVEEINGFLKERGYQLLSHQQDIEALKDAHRRGDVSQMEKWENLHSEINKFRTDLDKAMEAVKRLRALINNARGLGLDVESYVSRVGEAEEALKNVEFKRALDIATNAIEELESIVGLYHSIIKDIEEAKSSLEKAQRAGMDITHYQREIMMALALLENREFDEAKAKAEGIKNALKTIVESVGSLEDKLRILKARIRIMERSGANTESIKRGMEEALAAKDNGNYEVALEMATHLIEEAKTSLERYKTTNLMKDKIERELKRAVGEGAVVAGADDNMALVEELIGEGEYKRAEDMLSDIEGAVKKAREMHKRCIKELHAAWQKVIEVYRTGVIDIDDINILRDDIADMMKVGAYEEAEREMVSLQKMVIERLEASKAFMNELMPVQVMMEEMKRMGAGVERYRDELDLIKGMISAGDTDRAKGAIRELRKDLESHYTKNMELVELVGTAQKKIQEAKAMGLGTTEAEAIFHELSDAWSEGRFDEAKEKARKCIELLLRQELSRQG